MNDQSKIINDGVIREFVVPVKKHLAKFMLADDLKFENPKNLLQQIFFEQINNSPRKWNNDIVGNYQIDWLVYYLLNESILKENWFVSAKYYRKRNFSNNDRLFPYLKNNYTFIKIKVKVSKNTSYQKYQGNYSKNLNFDQLVLIFNEMINSHFIDLCDKYASCQPNRTKAIDEILFRLNIKPTEIKRESILRKLIRGKKNKSVESVYFETLIKRLNNSYLQEY